MTAGFLIGVTLIRAWVRLYTIGMPADLRETRRAEIDADLWDHQNDAERSGVSPGMLTLHILLRAALGASDDLNWRFESSLERRAAMVALSAKQVRWMGLGGLLGGVVWAGRYFVPGDPGTVIRGYGHIALSILLIVGLVGFYAQQRAGANRFGRAGFILLLTSFVAWSAMNVLGTVFRVNDQTLLMNLLAVAFVFLLAPGFLLLGIGLKGAARGVPLAIGGAFTTWLLLPRAALAQYFPSMTNWNRGDSPIGVTVFFLMGIGLALMGYSVFRNAAATDRSGRSDHPLS